jgi:glycolate oxidase FAD binding subunit
MTVSRERSMTVDDLAAIVGTDHVRDAGAEDAIDGVTPRWVVEPASGEEASRVLQLAHQAGLAVAPRGAGTKMQLGNLPARLDLILSTRRLNRVLEHAAGDLVARLEAGVRLTDAQEIFGRAGQWLAIDPPEPGATIGGIIAANASGPHRLRFGTMRDLLIGLTYVLSDGTIARAGGKVVKNVAGYDLGKLFTGSLGTLGLLGEVIVRLHPVPAARRIVLVTGLTDLSGAVQAILHSPLVPSAIELRGGKLESLAVLFEGVEPGVIAQAETAAGLLRPFGETRVSADYAAEWQPTPRLPTGWSRLKISVLPAQLNAVRAAIMNSVAGDTGANIHGHAGNGILYLDIGSDPPTQITCITALRERAVAHGGSLVVTAAPLEVKQAVDGWGDAGTALTLMRRVKERFDPDGIMNPGRFVGGI